MDKLEDFGTCPYKYLAVWLHWPPSRKACPTLRDPGSGPTSILTFATCEFLRRSHPAPRSMHVSPATCWYNMHGPPHGRTFQKLIWSETSGFIVLTFYMIFCGRRACSTNLCACGKLTYTKQPTKRDANRMTWRSGCRSCLVLLQNVSQNTQVGTALPNCQPHEPATTSAA